MQVSARWKKARPSKFWIRILSKDLQDPSHWKDHVAWRVRTHAINPKNFGNDL